MVSKRVVFGGRGSSSVSAGEAPTHHPKALSSVFVFSWVSDVAAVCASPGHLVILLGLRTRGEAEFLQAGGAAGKVAQKKPSPLTPGALLEVS